MNLLLINAFFYIIPFLYFCRKKGVTVYTLLWLWFSIIAFLGYYTFEVGIYEDTFGPKKIGKLTFLPYIFCFIGYIIAFEPFRKISPELETHIPYRKYTDVLINLYIVVMIVYLLLKVSEALLAVSYGLADAKNLIAEDGETIYDYSDNIILKRINQIRGFFQMPLTPFIIAYCVQCWKLKIHGVKTIILVVLCFLPDVFAAVGRGQRSGIFITAMNVAFFAVFYLRQIPPRVKRFGVIGIAAFSFVAATYSLAITEDRFQKADSPITPILRYFGEPFPNLGFLYYGKAHDYCWGGRKFPGIINTEKKHNVYTLVEKQEYWTKVTGMPNQNFKTYFGDMYMELSTIGAFIFIIINAFIFKILTGPRLTVYNMCFLYLYFQQIARSFMGAGMMGIDYVKSLIFMFIVSILIKKLYFGENVVPEKEEGNTQLTENCV